MFFVVFLNFSKLIFIGEIGDGGKRSIKVDDISMKLGECSGKCSILPASYTSSYICFLPDMIPLAIA